MPSRLLAATLRELTQAQKHSENLYSDVLAEILSAIETQTMIVQQDRLREFRLSLDEVRNRCLQLELLIAKPPSSAELIDTKTPSLGEISQREAS